MGGCEDGWTSACDVGAASGVADDARAPAPHAPSPKPWPHPPQVYVSPLASMRRAIDPVPQMMTMPPAEPVAVYTVPGASLATK